MDMQKIVIILGPTSSGKSDTGINMAEDFNGEIISADSMKVYRLMDIGTAKPDIEKRKKVYHHLIDIINPDEEFSANNFREISIEAINKLHRERKNIFIVGGTGLYIKALLGGLLKLPEPEAGIRERLRNEVMEYGANFLYKRLKNVDPISAINIHPNDVFRIIRALEIYEQTGIPVSRLRKEHNFMDKRFEVLKVGLFMEREELYRKINKRVDMMITKGLIEEVKTLQNYGYHDGLRSMQSLGYKEVSMYLKGKLDIDGTIRKIKKRTRNFAKRQITWFRADKDIIWYHYNDTERIKESIKRFIGR